MINVGVAGRFKLEAVNEETGERRELVPWFNNLITDQGLNVMGTAWLGSNGYCVVGTGTATPAVTDTVLAAKLAHTNTATSVVTGGSATAPYYSSYTKVFRFAAGVATGNLSELGVCVASSTTLVFSRTLIKDGSGNPTTITVLSTEALDVTYELRLYAPSADAAHTTMISGVPYTGVIRAANVTSFSSSGYTWFLGNSVGNAVDIRINSYSPRVYTGGVGAITASPSGTSADISDCVSATYSNNSLQRTGTTTVGLSQGNLSGGIGALLIPTALGTYQIGFSPPIPKDATKVLTLGLTLSWNRMVI